MDMNEQYKGVTILIILVLIVGGFFLFKPSTLSHLNPFADVYYPTQHERGNLTERMNMNGVTYFFSEDCGYCKQQEKFFNLSLMENKVNLTKSYNPIITSLPAWEKDMEYTFGVLTYEELEDKYGRAE